MGPVGPFAGPTGYFQPIWDTFWLALDHIWDILGLANGPNWSALMSSVLFQPCSNQFYKNYGIKAYYVIFGSKSPFLHNFAWKKDPTLSGQMPMLWPSNSKYALRANLRGQKAIFSLFWPLFGPLLAIFGIFWVWQMGQTGQPKCPQCCSNLVPTCSTKRYDIRA